jgi:hypothetical protein
MDERYMSRGVGIAMGGLMTLALSATAAAITAAMARCPGAGASAFWGAFPLGIPLLCLLTTIPVAWRRMLTWQGMLRVVVLLLAVQLGCALVACRAVVLE